MKIITIEEHLAGAPINRYLAKYSAEDAADRNQARQNRDRDLQAKRLYHAQRHFRLSATQILREGAGCGSDYSLGGLSLYLQRVSITVY